MKRLFFVLLLPMAALAACKHDPAPAVDAGPAAASSTPVAPATFDGESVVKGACLSCHTQQMLAQQRLTPAQWQKVVTKMVGWGANLEASDTEPLVKYLADTYGPDAGPFVPDTITSEAAAKELAPLPDGPFANGNVERGTTLFAEKCSACHGADARGNIGINLVERPILGRAFDVAEDVHRGKGKMTPMPSIKDAELADILAYLRTLKNP